MARRQQYIFSEAPRRGRGFLIGFLVVLLILLAGLSTWNFALNHSVKYDKQYVTVTNLPSDLENWTILHLSDLNGASLGENQSALKKALASRSFSCVVLSGGMVGKAGDVQPLLDLIGIFPKGTPILLLPSAGDPPLYATSAHASLSPYADWAATLQAAGVTILDEPVCFERGKAKIWFVPESLYSLNLDSSEMAYRNQLDTLNAAVGDLTADQAALRRTAEYQLERIARIRESIAAIGTKDIQIAVSHYPLTRDYVARAKAAVPATTRFSMHNVSLVLAGGYVGGQWRLPGGGPIYVPGKGFFPDDATMQGLGYLGGVWQHVSPGLDVNPIYPLPPFRLFNSPAATMLVLSSSVH